MEKRAKSDGRRSSPETELSVSRAFDAPRSLVWEVFTDPKHVGTWWGPNGFTITTHEMDVRPGGIWSFVMHGPDGVDYDNFIRYNEVTKYERLAFDHGEDEHRIYFKAEITFVERNGQTEVTLRHFYDTVEDRTQAIEEYNAVEGGKQTLARLAEYLTHMESV